jgi:hypothetical protein
MKLNSSLTRIESIGGSMTSLGLLRMGDLLRANSRIKSVALAENGHLEKAGFEMFCNSFKRGQLSELCIQSNALTSPLVDVLAAASGLRCLRTLSLPNTSIDAKVTICICRAYRSSLVWLQMFETLSAGLYSCAYLEKLNVSGNQLHLGGAIVLARLMMILKSSLRTVQAARNHFDDEVCSLSSPIYALIS